EARGVEVGAREVLENRVASAGPDPGIHGSPAHQVVLDDERKRDHLERAEVDRIGSLNAEATRDPLVGGAGLDAELRCDVKGPREPCAAAVPELDVDAGCLVDGGRLRDVDEGAG